MSRVYSSSSEMLLSPPPGSRTSVCPGHTLASPLAPSQVSREPGQLSLHMGHHDCKMSPHTRFLNSFAGPSGLSVPLRSKATANQSKILGKDLGQPSQEPSSGGLTKHRFIMGHNRKSGMAQTCSPRPRLFLSPARPPLSRAAVPTSEQEEAGNESGYSRPRSVLGTSARSNVAGGPESEL